MDTKSSEKTDTSNERYIPRQKYLEENRERSKRTRQIERKVAKKIGATRLPCSGAKHWSPWVRRSQGADLSTKELHIEHKRTERGSLSVQREWLRTTSEEARRRGKDPALILMFENEKEMPEEWIMMPLDSMMAILKDRCKDVMDVLPVRPPGTPSVLTRCKKCGATIELGSGHEC